MGYALLIIKEHSGPAMRRLFIAATLCTLGVAAYLLVSEGPALVQFITVLVQVFFLVTISYFAWMSTLVWRRRIIALAFIVIVGSAAATYLDSFVIAKLAPLHPIHFATGLLGFLVEALLFLGATWLVDRIICSVQEAMRQSTSD